MYAGLPSYLRACSAADALRGEAPKGNLCGGSISDMGAEGVNFQEL